MASPLTEGCIRRIHESASQDQMNDGVVVQVLEVKKIEPKAGQSGDRYRLVISDGAHYIQGMLATQLNSMIQSDQLQTNSIISLQQYICNKINDKRVIIMLDISVIQQRADPIGEPKNIQQAPGGIPQNFGGGVKPEQGRTQPNFMNRGAPAAYGAAPAAAGGYGQQQGATTFHPIASLHPYNNRWTIKARVTAKSEKRTWTNDKGQGSLFSVDLLDASGGQIKATMFKDAAEKFYDIFHENQVYIISKGQLKLANKKWNLLPNEYELTLNSDAEVIPVENDASIEALRFEFVLIENIGQIQPNEHCDIIGIVTQIGQKDTITAKVSGKELDKRSITLMDKTLCQVEVTLWGAEAQKWNEETLANNPVLAVKGCKVSDYGGRSLSSSFQSQIYLNPDRPEAHQLRAWFDSARDTLQVDEVKNISRQRQGGSGEGGAAAGGASNQRKLLSDIKDENLGMGPAADFFTTRAMITFFRYDWEKSQNQSAPWYMACPNPQCKNKKVSGDEHSGWVCEKCHGTQASARYILSLMVCDHTGSTWLTAFNDAAETLLNKTKADVLLQYKKDNNKTPVEDIFKSANFKEYYFKVRCKSEPSQDNEQRVRAHIISVHPVNWIEETRLLFEELQRYD